MKDSLAYLSAFVRKGTFSSYAKNVSAFWCDIEILQCQRNSDISIHARGLFQTGNISSTFASFLLASLSLIASLDVLALSQKDRVFAT